MKFYNTIGVLLSKGARVNRIAAYLIIMFIFSFSACDRTQSGKLSTDSLDKIIKEANQLTLEGKYEDALKKFDEITALDNDDEQPDIKDKIAKAYCTIGYIQMFHYNDYMESFESLTRAKEIAESLPESQQLCYIYVNLAALYKVYADKRTAAHYLDLGFDEALYHKKYHVLLTAAFNMLSEGFAGQLSSDSRQRLKKLRRLNIPEDPMREVVTGMLNAYLLYEEGKGQDALVEIEKIKEDAAQNPSYERLSDLCDILSLSVSMNSHLEDRSNVYASRLEADLDSLDNDNKLAALFQLANNYHAIGNNDKGYFYYDRAFHLNDSIFSVGQYSLLHDWELKNKEKRHSEKMQSAIDDKNRLWKILIGVSALLIASGVTGSFIAHQNKKLKTRNRLLYNRYTLNNQLEEELVEMRKEREDLLLHISETSELKQSESVPENQREPNTRDNEMPAEEMEEEEINGEDEKEDEKSRSRERELIMIRALTPKVSDILNSDEVTSPDFSLEKLARLTGSNRAYVSKVINNLYKKNFKAVLNDIRIRIACDRLRETGMYRNMTVEALAESVGYKSSSNFVVTFKKITGLSPSDYRKAAE